MSMLDLLQQASTAVYVPVEVVGKPLAAALGLSLVVERTIEVLKNISDLLPTTVAGRAVRPWADVERSVADLASFHERCARGEQAEADLASALAKIADLRYALATAAPADQPALQQEIAEAEKMFPSAAPNAPALEPTEGYPTTIMLVEPATDPDDRTTLRAFVLQAVALAVGIVAAHVAGVQLFTPLYQHVIGNLQAQLPGGVGTDYMLTGLLIGGGSGPVHMLIEFIGARTRMGIAPTAEPAPAQAAASAVGAAASGAPVAASGQGGVVVAAPPIAPAAPVVLVATSFDWIDLPYDGGVDRGKLESVHRRPGDPNLIVYHHTAMPLSSTFEDVVRVIKDRTDGGAPWITGYHCVVTADGVSHPFCRWDRFGNHAAGYNARSLGISLNGNFETNPQVPFSNPDGRYGPAQPTAAQLAMAARVVALWTYLYQIDVDFQRTIIPHQVVSDKTCPGSNFPYAEFQKLVERFHDAWTTPTAKAQIEAFAAKPYLFV